ncbi:MAG: hypothetical protein F7C37_06480 [Desulfurococcales archaeon]|nr:hypothetical protein [Desulfurococcales archaeon]
MVNEYKRNIYVYALVGVQENKVLDFDYVLKVIDYIVRNMYPVNSRDNPFSWEKTPTITEMRSLGRVQGRRAFGFVYGYLRHEGLSAVLERSTRRQSPLSERLKDDEDLYEYAHMVVLEPGIALVETTGFAPRHGVMSKLLTGAAKEYCNTIGGRKVSLPICDKTYISLRPLYRRDIQELLKKYAHYPIRSIRIKLELDREGRLRKRTVIKASVERLLRRFGVSIDSLLEGAITVDSRVGVGRLRDASLDLTLDDLVQLAAEIREALGEDALRKLTISFGEKMGTIDLVEDQLVFREIPIKKAIVRGHVHRSTDTNNAFAVLSDLASKNLDTILDSYRAFSDRFPFRSSSR